VTPVCRVDTPCTAPYAHATLVFTRPGKTSRRVTTDAKGKYRLGLPPGRWSLRVREAQFTWKPTTVTVPRGRYAHVNVSVDTGIR
jgi:hypothetical protein